MPLTPRRRYVHPETWTDDKFVQLPPLARLLFIGMWNFSCDNGHLEDNALQLKMRVLPADNCDVSELLRELIDRGRVEVKNGYLKIPRLREYQPIDKRWIRTCEWCSDDPDSEWPTGYTRPNSRAHTGTRVHASEHTPAVAVAFAVASKKTPHKRGETDLDSDADFVAFWAAYPKRVAKGQAKRAWSSALRTKVPAADIIAGAKSYAITCQGTDPKFVANPSTWLNGERWTDEQVKPPRDPDAWMQR
jgi:hypothetical protein